MGDIFSNRSSNTTIVGQSFVEVWPPESWSDLHIAVAVSGGCDSMALLRMVHFVKEKVGGEGRIAAFHVNHRLRGGESDADAKWVQEQCQALGVDCQILVADTLGRAAADGDGLESAAREERYHLLIGAAEQMGARYLAMAHTQDDQIETVLFRLLRGSGLRGLRGIPQTRQLSSAVTLVRPLIDCTRFDLEAYLTEIDQPFRIDSSNHDLSFTRNRLRHDLLPKLRAEYNSNVDVTLLQLATQAEETDQWLEAEARALLGQAKVQIESGSPKQVRFELPQVDGVHTVLLTTAIRILWWEAGLSEQGMTYSWWQQLANGMLSKIGEQILNLPGDVRAEIAIGRLLLEWHSE